jgi:peptide deformylase
MTYPKEILLYPKDEEVLRTPSKPVSVFDQSLVSLFEEMERLTKEVSGYGFSAIQIGIPLRACIVRLSDKPEHKYTYLRFCNIEIEEEQDDVFIEEGCLSCPSLQVPIHAPENVVMKCQNEFGEQMRYSMAGMSARCVKHELNHQNGFLIIDKVNKFKLNDVKKKYLKDLKRMGL